jgi:cytochrome d ubiquinol oxidase subunit II
VGTNPGILDWYTVMTGLLALVTLTVHGSHYIAVKTEGEVHDRARRVAGFGWLMLVLLTVVSLLATIYVRPQILQNFRIRIWGWIIPVLVLGALVSMPILVRKGRDLAAFVASTAYIVGMLGGAAFAIYPNLLPSSTNPSNSLTISNAKTGAYSLRVGLVWWLLGIALAIGCFTFIYRSFWGKVALDEEGGY